MLVISLLANYYTLYYRDETIFSRFTHLDEFGTPPPRKIILYGEGSSEKAELRQTQQLKRIVQEHFPEHQFIPHEILFSFKITGGLPDGEDLETIEKEYPVYRYLFGYTEFLNVTEVID